MKTIFLTGATGFIGSNLACALLRAGYGLKLLVRDRKTGAAERFRQSLEYLLDSSDEYANFQDRFEIIRGEMTQEHMGIPSDALKKLRSDVDIVLHCAALTSFQEAEKGLLEKCNVEGARNILDFTIALKSPSRALYYVSTAYVCGQSSGVFTEDDLDTGQDFNNSYEETKFRAEQLIHEYRDKFNLSASIFRPSIVTGDSRTGKASRFDGVYSYVKALHLIAGLFAKDLERGGKRASAVGAAYRDNRLDIPVRMQADPDKTLNIVPVDYVTDCVVRCIRTSAGPTTYHIINRDPPTLGRLHETVSSLLNVSGIRLAGRNEFSLIPMTDWESFFSGSLREIQPYLETAEPVFTDDNMREVLKGTSILCPEITVNFLETLFAFFISGARSVK
ncbi:MAG: SDR family oxidoreductase [Nitrospirae bacterium]|nr:SDR family oxidoreductase [Nitrospirota bacterium]